MLSPAALAYLLPNSKKGYLKMLAARINGIKANPKFAPDVKELSVTISAIASLAPSNFDTFPLKIIPSLKHSRLKVKPLIARKNTFHSDRNEFHLFLTLFI